MSLFKELEKILLHKIGVKSLEHLSNVASDVHKNMTQHLRIDYSNQPDIFMEIVSYVKANANTNDGKHIHTLLYDIYKENTEERITFYICLNKNVGMLEIRFDFDIIDEDDNSRFKATNGIQYDYNSRIANTRLANQPDLEVSDIDRINFGLNALYQEFLEREQQYLNGDIGLINGEIIYI